MHSDDRDLLLEYMTWYEAQDARDEHRVLLIPIGAIEQHGPHLPQQLVIHGGGGGGTFFFFFCYS